MFFQEKEINFDGAFIVLWLYLVNYFVCLNLLFRLFLYK